MYMYKLSSLDLMIWSILCKPLIYNRWSIYVYLLRLLEELFDTGIVVSVSQLHSKAEAIYLRFESSVAMYAAAAAIALAVIEMKVAVLVVIVTVAPVMEAMCVVALHLWFAAGYSLGVDVVSCLTLQDQAEIQLNVVAAAVVVQKNYFVGSVVVADVSFCFAD